MGEEQREFVLSRWCRSRVSAITLHRHLEAIVLDNEASRIHLRGLCTEYRT